ncbi:hypothetical protein COCNU_09G010050 [Cocos nucifera]|uniref:Uncharacterized protein n=1 Tax=Cocos nucifera TaxID=13894 RepID=A0A8K0IKT8_COCNU|nr:hypothetical protein COCNU_09G010050 [Cocos nucifera]
MGARRRTLLLGFVVALFLGFAIYFRLWAIDNESFSADDREVLRKQFERANLEAMDESAEWRMKYDTEVEKSRLFQDELLKVCHHCLKSESGKDVVGPIALSFKDFHYQGAVFSEKEVKASLTSATKRFAVLQKENMSLQKQVESLKQQIGAKEQHCNCNRSPIQHQQ